jgi:hypothetical protein
VSSDDAAKNKAAGEKDRKSEAEALPTFRAM